jgi:hypothetical protein
MPQGMVLARSLQRAFFCGFRNRTGRPHLIDVDHLLR